MTVFIVHVNHKLDRHFAGVPQPLSAAVVKTAIELQCFVHDGEEGRLSKSCPNLPAIAIPD